MGFTDYRLIGCISYVYPTVYGARIRPLRRASRAIAPQGWS